MISAKDVSVDKLLVKLSADLGKMEEMKPPEWSAYVKTGVNRQRVPENKDWWYVRSSSILRKLYMNNPVGVERLRKVYGGRKNNGTAPEHKKKASGAIIRNIFQQLEKAGLVKTEKGKGRMLTPKGRSFVSKSIKSISA
ncbi:MAG: 30S ribosomal protein S19e [Candidatus Aenigmarchaeota archaeon]|nr:30S ribosomal protein S19e [Candidatus Aenigmarchaeota archaeon]